MSAIFYHNEEQKSLAIATKKEQEKRRSAPIATAILPAKDFYNAEEWVPSQLCYLLLEENKYQILKC